MLIIIKVVVRYLQYMCSATRIKWTNLLKTTRYFKINAIKADENKTDICVIVL